MNLGFLCLLLISCDYVQYGYCIQYLIPSDKRQVIEYRSLALIYDRNGYGNVHRRFVIHDRLQWDLQPILPVFQPVTINTMLNKNGPF